MQRAPRSLRSARNMLEDGDHDSAVSRAYYAMFYAATAALLSRDLRRTKHAGVIAAFGQQFVKTGDLAVEHQRALMGAFQDRTAGDYAGAFPSRERVDQRLAEADAFVDAVEALLRACDCFGD